MHTHTHTHTHTNTHAHQPLKLWAGYHSGPSAVIGFHKQHHRPSTRTQTHAQSHLREVHSARAIFGHEWISSFISCIIQTKSSDWERAGGCRDMQMLFLQSHASTHAQAHTPTHTHTHRSIGALGRAVHMTNEALDPGLYKKVCSQTTERETPSVHLAPTPALTDTHT